MKENPGSPLAVMMVTHNAMESSKHSVCTHASMHLTTHLWLLAYKHRGLSLPLADLVLPNLKWNQKSRWSVAKTSPWVNCTAFLLPSQRFKIYTAASAPSRILSNTERGKRKSWHLLVGHCRHSSLQAQSKLSTWFCALLEKYKFKQQLKVKKLHTQLHWNRDLKPKEFQIV